MYVVMQNISLKLTDRVIPEIFLRYLVKKRIKKRFKKVVGYDLNLESPQSYCEKIQWLKLNYLEHNPEIIQCADKYRVRDYLKKQGLSDFLVTLYGCWNTPKDILWDTLPNAFVLKLNNGSGRKYMWLIPDKNSVNKNAVFKDVYWALRNNFGYKHGEFHYRKIQPKIMAEEYLKDNRKDIRDYKFYCFNGDIAFLSIEQGRRTTKHVRGYYDTNLNKAPVKFVDDLDEPDPPFERPGNFETMIDIAQQLSKGHPHVRVDLYNTGGRIYIGELTFAPECGYTPWDPAELDFEYGKRINLDIAQSFLKSNQIA